MSTQEEIDEEKKLFTIPTQVATRATFQNRNKGLSDGGQTKPIAPVNVADPKVADIDPSTIKEEKINSGGAGINRATAVRANENRKKVNTRG
jgi:hypothetical protein